MTESHPEPPPARLRWRYYVFGLTPPLRYRDWVIADIESESWRWRRGLQQGVGMSLGFLLGALILDEGPDLVMVPLALVLATVLVAAFAGNQRDRTISYYEKRWRRKEESPSAP